MVETVDFRACLGGTPEAVVIYGRDISVKLDNHSDPTLFTLKPQNLPQIDFVLVYLYISGIGEAQAVQIGYTDHGMY